MSPLHQLLRRDGVMLRREAILAGLTDRTLARAVRHEQLVRVRHGAYAAKEAYDRLDPVARHALTARAVVRQAKTAVALSHLSALAVLGGPLWDLPLDEVHVTRLDERTGRREVGVAQHRIPLLSDELVRRADLWLTHPARAGVELTTITDVEHALPMLDWLLHHELATRAQLRHHARRLEAVPGSLRTMLAIALADGRAESVGESRIRYLCWVLGLPAPEPNYEIRDSHGRVVARVDLAWPAYGVFLEFDGKEKYSRWRRPGEDVVDTVRRQNEREQMICSITGWRCVRVRWAHLYRPEPTGAWLRSVLNGAPVYDNPLYPRW